MADKRYKIIKIIAFWMVLSTIPGIMYYLDHGLHTAGLLQSCLEWLYYISVIVSAMGLYKCKEWARWMAVRLFIIYFFWALFIAKSLVGPSLRLMMELLSAQYGASPGTIKLTLVVSILMYILWPIMAVLFLTHPSVKYRCSSGYNAEEEAEELKRKP